MASTSHNPSDAPGAPDDAAQLGHLLGFAQNMLDEETRRTDRLEARSRQAFGATGALFAVVMATTAGVLNALLRQNHVHGWVYPVLGGAAIASIIALGIALAWTLQVDKVYKVEAIDPQTIEDYVAPARKGKVAVTTNLINGYARLVRIRRDNNLKRYHDLKVARAACGVAAAATLCQLAAVFAALIAR